MLHVAYSLAYCLGRRAASATLISPLHEVCSSIAHDVVQSNVPSFPRPRRPVFIKLRAKLGMYLPAWGMRFWEKCRANSSVCTIHLHCWDNNSRCPCGWPVSKVCLLYGRKQESVVKYFFDRNLIFGLTFYWPRKYLSLWETINRATNK